MDEITETIEPKVATERVQTEFLTVEAGQAAGVHQIARGLSEGKELIYMELQMYVGAKDPADTVELTGPPEYQPGDSGWIAWGYRDGVRGGEFDTGDPGERRRDCGLPGICRSDFFRRSIEVEGISKFGLCADRMDSCPVFVCGMSKE